MFPQARKEDLIVERMDGETLVYDLRSHKAHCLNPTAAFIWESCDGRTSLKTIIKKAQSKFGRDANEDVVRLALHQLGKSRLLTERVIAADDPSLHSRRELLKRLGKTAAIAVPLVTSIVAPTAAQAASCVTTAQCTSSGRDWVGQCCCNAKICKKTGPNYACNGAAC